MQRLSKFVLRRLKVNYWLVFLSEQSSENITYPNSITVARVSNLINDFARSRRIHQGVSVPIGISFNITAASSSSIYYNLNRRIFSLLDLLCLIMNFGAMFSSRRGKCNTFMGRHFKSSLSSRRKTNGSSLSSANTRRRCRRKTRSIRERSDYIKHSVRR